MTASFDPFDGAELLDTVERLLSVYHPACLDETNGGYVAQFDEETGEVYDRSHKHLVAQARFVVNYSVAAALDGPEWCRPAARHGLRFLQTRQRDDEHGGFHWLLRGTDPVDRRRVCYGHAFALLAVARAVDADVGDHADDLRAAAALLDRFWEPEHGRCASEFSPDWQSAADYRGQNANMHACEALLAAYEATGDDRYLGRALTIAESVTVDLAAETDGLIWEHYTADWTHDFAYNRDEPTDTFRPWGYQPGHHAEWAKLLATLDRYADADWLLSRARDLFDAAIEYGWDDARGGFYYTFDRDGDPVVTDKYSWEVAEAIGAAAILYDRTGDDQYRDWYDRCWTYALDTMVNPDHGNWYTKVTADNDPVPRTEGVAVEPGYHPIGACRESYLVFGP